MPGHITPERGEGGKSPGSTMSNTGHATLAGRGGVYNLRDGLGSGIESLVACSPGAREHLKKKSELSKVHIYLSLMDFSWPAHWGCHFKSVLVLK